MQAVAEDPGQSASQPRRHSERGALRPDTEDTPAGVTPRRQQPAHDALVTPARDYLPPALVSVAPPPSSFVPPESPEPLHFASSGFSSQRLFRSPSLVSGSPSVKS